VRILHGSALALPVPHSTYDAAYSQNVIMNIADKAQFYREAFRALRSGGRLALSNLCAGPGGEPYFPAPWAPTCDASFLETPEAMKANLAAAGFEIVAFHDITPEILEAIRRSRERSDKGSAQRIAVDVLMGDRALEMRINSTRTLEEGRGLDIEALARKP
jgi:ubiquinone/menaquinone biosynthesis C-methylase UbiE